MSLGNADTKLTEFHKFGSEIFVSRIKPVLILYGKIQKNELNFLVQIAGQISEKNVNNVFVITIWKIGQNFMNIQNLVRYPEIFLRAYFYFFIRLPPELLPVLGPLEW